MARYTCAACGIAAIVITENSKTVIIRPCGHDTAGIKAEMSAHASGSAFMSLSRK